MDFSDHTFDDDVSFSGRILVNASFKGTKFHSLADFRCATFVGPSDFNNSHFNRRCRFDDVAFENTVYFKNATFMETTVFVRTAFKVAAHFDGSRFLPIPAPNECPLGGVGFGNAGFASDASFEGAQFNVPCNFEETKFYGNITFRTSTFLEKASFQRTIFEHNTDFSSAAFKREANFNDASFKSTTYFRCSIFLEPPRFFETTLHEDTDFNGVDWHKAESCYMPSWLSKFTCGDTKNAAVSDLVDASSAIQAWDRLALVMSKLEKLPERHNFYRLRMRAQRKRDGWGILSFANLLFDMCSDYGWSIRRALLWWSLHYIAVGLLLYFQTNSVAERCASVLADSLLVSFSNAHAFLGLASPGGYLYESRQCVVAAVPDIYVLNVVGAIQSIIGPILLFLLLLTLRNRFRLK